MKYIQIEKNKLIDVLKQKPFKNFDFYIQLFSDNKEMMLEILKKDGYLLHDTSEELRNDKEIVIDSVKQEGCSLKLASIDLIKNEDFLYELYEKGCLGFFQHAPKEIKKKYDNSIKKIHDSILDKINITENNKINKIYIKNVL